MFRESHALQVRGLKERIATSQAQKVEHSAFYKVDDFVVLESAYRLNRQFLPLSHTASRSSGTHCCNVRLTDVNVECVRIIPVLMCRAR